MGVFGAVEKALEPLSPEQRVIVACSGGADSVALAAATCAVLGSRRVVLAHVDHALRSTSPDDALAVAALARYLGATFHGTRLDPGPDDEARLRSLRYRSLESARAEHHAAWILTAHTAADQAETVLLNLIRAARPESLRGIPRARGVIVRPLLDVRRSELRAYLATERLGWREDPTNLEPRWLRNRIRKELLPLIESRYRSGITARLARLAGLMQGAADERPAAAVRGVPKGGENTSSQPASNTGRPPIVPHLVPPDIAIERRPWTGGAMPRDLSTAVFDADALDRVIVRPMRPGDRIRPLGLEGTKKLSDVLIDAKVPRDARPAVWVAAHPSGEVLWVPGLARGQAAPILPTTTQVWVLSCGGLAEAPLSPGGS